MLGLLNGGMFSVEAEWCYGKNESSIFSTVPNSVHPEHPDFLNNGGLLEAICLWTLRVYCTRYKRK
jgi:hypothetical protein